MTLTFDWSLMRQQKEWLLTQTGPESDGLLNMLDAIQDAAVAEGVSEEEVFGIALTE